MLPFVRGNSHTRVIYGSLVWRVCNRAAPAGPRGIPGLSPVLPIGMQTGGSVINIRMLVQCLHAMQNTPGGPTLPHKPGNVGRRYALQQHNDAARGDAAYLRQRVTGTKSMFHLYKKSRTSPCRYG